MNLETTDTIARYLIHAVKHVESLDCTMILQSRFNMQAETVDGHRAQTTLIRCQVVLGCPRKGFEGNQLVSY